MSYDARLEKTSRCLVSCKKFDTYAYRIFSDESWQYSNKWTEKTSKCTRPKCYSCPHSKLCSKITEDCDNCNYKFRCIFLFAEMDKINEYL
jgi:hypothetical protein